MAISRLGLLFEHYGKQDVKSCSCVISTDTAIVLMREALQRPIAQVSFNEDDDVLFLYDKVPVVLRHRAPPGHAVIVEKRNLPPRSCCDITATETVMLCLSKGTA